MEGESLTLRDVPRAILHYVLDFLGPRDLCIASAVCRRWRDLNRDPASTQVWQAFYSQRWRPPVASKLTEPMCWQSLYSQKMRKVSSYGGRASTDILQGHGDAVRCVGLLPSCNLLASGGRDRMVRLWDLKAGMALSNTRSPVGSVRSLALDENLLVVGGTDPDYQLCAWHASDASTRALPHSGDHFNMSHPVMMTGHTGPISAVALDSMLVYSGSWDYTVRMWHRGDHSQPPRCASVLAFDDWVWCVCPRGSNLLVAAGCSTLVHDVHTGHLLRTYTDGGPAEHRVPMRVEGSRDGRLLFANSQAGSLLAYDLRSSSHAPAARLWEQNATVRSLAFEDPWLTAALADGTVLLLNTEAAMRRTSSSRSSSSKSSSSRASMAGSSGHARSFAGSGWRPQCIDIMGQWMAAGEEGGIIRTWDFTNAEVAGERVRRGQLARAARKERKAARWQAGEKARPAETGPSTPLGTRDRSLAAARQALLESLLAEDAQAGELASRDSAPDPDDSQEAGPTGFSAEKREHGRADPWQRSAAHESSMRQDGQGHHARTGSVDENHEDVSSPRAGSSEASPQHEDSHAADLSGGETSPGPVKKGERRRARRGYGKLVGPHTASLQGRVHSLASPPPLVASRGAGDSGHRANAGGMATWRIVRPVRVMPSPSGK